MQDSIRTFWIFLIRGIQNNYRQPAFFQELTLVKEYVVALAQEYGKNYTFMGNF